MILIISKSQDQNTSDVIRWLDAMNAHWFRINADEDNVVLKHCNLERKEFTLSINDDTLIESKNISKIWYRRGKILTDISDQTENPENALFIREELSVLEEFLWKSLENISLSNYLYSIPNKLITLNIAQACGIKTPSTSIISDKSYLKKEKASKKEIITKPLSDPLIYKQDKSWIQMYTTELDQTTIASLPDAFHPSLIQEKVNAQFEVRSVFINDHFYSVAIFPEQESFHRDIRKKMNQHRYSTIQIPSTLSNKVARLIKKMNLNFCCIDFMYSEKEGFVFLEINPVGQFGFVSKNGNYCIEKMIAEELIK